MSVSETDYKKQEQNAKIKWIINNLKWIFNPTALFPISL